MVSILSQNKYRSIKLAVRFSLLLLVSFSFICELEISDEPASSNYSGGATAKENVRAPQVVLLNHQFNSTQDPFDTIMGQVKNIGSETAQYVQVFVNTYDKNGEVIESNFINSTVGDLKAGQMSSFNLSSSKDKFEVMYDYDLAIQWRGQDGQVQKIENAKTYLE